MGVLNEKRCKNHNVINLITSLFILDSIIKYPISFDKFFIYNVVR